MGVWSWASSWINSLTKAHYQRAINRRGEATVKAHTGILYLQRSSPGYLDEVGLKVIRKWATAAQVSASNKWDESGQEINRPNTSETPELMYFRPALHKGASISFPMEGYPDRYGAVEPHSISIQIQESFTWKMNLLNEPMLFQNRTSI